MVARVDTPMGAPPASPDQDAAIPDIIGGASTPRQAEGPTIEERRQGIIAQVRQFQSQLVPMVQADPSFERFQKIINNALMGYLKQIASQIGGQGERGLPRA